MKATRASLLTLLGGITLFTLPAFAQTLTTPDVPTEASGYFKLQAAASSDNKLSIPLNRPAVAYGFVSDIDSGSITISLVDPNSDGGPVSPGWDNSQFKYDLGASPAQAETYYVEFTSGPIDRSYEFCGVRYRITDNTDDTLSLDTEGDDLTAQTLAVGDTIVIRPYWRIKDVFEYGGSPLIGAVSDIDDALDDILLPNYTTQAFNKAPNRTLRYVTGSGWRMFPDPDTDQSNVILPPNYAFILRRRTASALTVPVVGNVPPYRSVTFVSGGTSGNDTYLSLHYPLPISLEDSGLHLDSPVVRDSSDPDNPIDRLMGFSAPSGYNQAPSLLYYFYESNGWRLFPDDTTPKDSTLLQAGTAYVLRRYAEVFPSTGVDWFQPALDLQLLGVSGVPTLSGSNQITVTWPTVSGTQYQVQTSTDLLNWTDSGSLTTSSGSDITATETMGSNPKFYRLEQKAIRSSFFEGMLTRQDDAGRYGAFSENPSIGFTINLFGTSYSDLWVNNNGNLTFDGEKGEYTPSDILRLGTPMIAPFWADVDTRLGSLTPRPFDGRPVYFGQGTVNGHQAFAASFIDVGYFAHTDEANTDRQNSFQVVLINREDSASGDFDVEFNYNHIGWETGEASSSGGTDGLGGHSARAGISDGFGLGFELAGSGVNSALLDEDPSTHVPSSNSLVHHSYGSSVNGRYVFQVRSGAVLSALLVNAGSDITTAANVTSFTLPAPTVTDPSNPSPTLSYSWELDPSQNPSVPTGATVTITNPSSASTTVTCSPSVFPSGNYYFRVTVWRSGQPLFKSFDNLMVTVP